MPETYGREVPWQPKATEADLWSERRGAERVELLRDAFGWVTPMDFMVALAGNPATLPFDLFAQRLINDGLPRDRVLLSLARLKSAEKAEEPTPRDRSAVQRPYNEPFPAQGVREQRPDKVPAPAQGAQEPAQGVRAREGRPVGPEALAPSERAATEWADGKDIPRHRKTRPSQQPGARRERWLRQLALQNNTTVAEQARLHPARGSREGAS